MTTFACSCGRRYASPLSVNICHAENHGDGWIEPGDEIPLDLKRAGDLNQTVPADLFRAYRIYWGLGHRQLAEMLGLGLNGKDLIDRVERGRRELTGPALRLFNAYRCGFVPIDWPQDRFAHPRAASVR